MSILLKVREKAKDCDCKVCGSKHAQSEIRVLGKLEATWIVRAACTKCQTASRLKLVLDEERAGMLGRP